MKNNITKIRKEISACKDSLSKLEKELEEFEGKEATLGEVEVGNIFSIKWRDEHPLMSDVIVISCGYGSNNYYLGGLNDTLAAYSDSKHSTREEVLQELNSHGYRFIGTLTLKGLKKK